MQVADLRIGVVLMLERGRGGVTVDVLQARVCTLNVTCHMSTGCVPQSHATRYMLVTCHLHDSLQLRVKPFGVLAQSHLSDA